MIRQARTGSRRRVGRAVTALAMATALATTLVTTSASARTSLDPATAASALHTDGRFARDGQGRVVVLHGLFGVWKTSTWDPTDSNTDPAGFTSTDARHVADLGFDVFRLAYFWEGLEPTPGQSVGSVPRRHRPGGAPVGHPQRARASSTRTRTCTARCSTATGSRPGRCTTTDITLVTDTGFPLNYFTPAVERTFTNFWADDQGVLDAYDQQLATVARRFAHDPMVLGYDLINEPFSGENQSTCASATGCPDWDADVLSPAEASMGRAVRSATCRTSSSSTSRRSSPTGARPPA